jgi:hypothetical protein
MRRFAIRLAAIALLLGLMPFTLGGCGITCACVAPADPNWTPPPMSDADARQAVVKFATAEGGASPAGLTSALDLAGQDRPIYTVVGETVAGIIDANTGLLLEFVQLDALPHSADTTVSATAAQASATRFLSHHDRYSGTLVASTTLQTSKATSAYVVSWAEKGGAPQLSVWIDPSSGTPFAFADQRHGVAVSPPIVGRGAAVRLAMAAVTTPDLEFAAADLRFDFAHPYWDVGLQSHVSGDVAPEHGAAVSVDAVTGAVTIGKSW